MHKPTFYRQICKRPSAMRRAAHFLLVWLTVCLPFRLTRAQQPSAASVAQQQPSALPPARRLLLAHYMPWFEANAVTHQWGWHWAMNHYHPDSITNGRREAASHYYPLLGLYDSNDPDVLECHVLLMKLAGVDGVLIDWYGTDDFLDFGINHRNTLHLVSYIKKAGLKFAVVYEDSAVPKLIAADRFPQAEAVAHGQALMRWMQANWFGDDAYLKQNKNPVFLVFGSGYYQGAQWEQIFSALPQPPQFFTESSRRLPAVGGFDWPQPGKGAAGSREETNRFYAAAKDWPQSIPDAFPRFHDIYAEAGVQKSWGAIDDQNGRTYEETLTRALQSDAPLIQLVTWNDWGEGTQIEPSVEFGYRDLEATQRLRRKYIKSPFPYTAQDLRLPLELYTLRKKFAADKSVYARLDRASALLFAGRLPQARQQLSALIR